MANRSINNVKLGIFVLVALVMLVFALYMVGKDTNLFSKNILLKVHFANVSGLMIGNNIRYAGIQVGSIKKINLLNDTLIEVDMLIDEKMKSYIHKKDWVSIATDGLVGNKILNITPGIDRLNLASEGSVLVAKAAIDTEDMLAILNKTNLNIAIISEDLKMTVQRLSNSTAFWRILNDNAIPDNLKASLLNMRQASLKADALVVDLHTVVQDVKNGKGSLGTILTDTAIAVNLNQAVEKIKSVADNANALAAELNGLTQNVKQDFSTSKGAYQALLKDTALVFRLNNSLQNIESGTAGFNANMEALKHNFFFRGYFKKLEKQKKKEAAELKRGSDL